MTDVGAAAEILAGVGLLAARLPPLGLALAVPLGLAGLAALTVGTRHRRALAVAGTAAVGALAAVALRGAVSAHLGLSAAPAAAALAVAGAALGGLVPPAFPFAAAALPGALAGSALPLGGRAELGAAAAALAAGVVGLLLARVVVAAASSLAGGLAVALALLAAFHERPLARELAARPAAVLGFALVAAIAGAALQLSRVTPPSPPRGEEGVGG